MEQTTTPNIEDSERPALPQKQRKSMPSGTTKTGRRKRSEERQRTAQFRVRLTPEEKAAMEAAAAAAGLDLAAFIRLRTLATKGPRTRRRIDADLAALASLRGELGYTGNNLNQLTRLANMGDMDRPAELDHVLALLARLYEQIDTALRGSE